MGGSTTTKVEQAPPSAEEKAYLDSQSELTRMQLEILSRQDAFNTDYLTQMKPLLDKQVQLMEQQLAAQLDPTAQQAAIDIANRTNSLTEKSLALQERSLEEQIANGGQDKIRNELETELLRSQLDAIKNGNNPTPEQIASIDAATSAARDAGRSEINAFTEDTMTRLRNSLAPSLGLRPTDTPIVDRGQLIAREGVRQFGQLESNLAGANAQARLNYPLAVSEQNNAVSSFQQNLKQATAQFQAGLADAAAINRLRLTSSASDLIGGATNTGVGLVTGSRGNPLSFTRGSTTTERKSMGIGDILGGAGGLMQGLGAMGLTLSDGRTKYDVATVGYDSAGHRWTRFKYKGDPSETEHVGVIAQEAERISPDAVLTDGTGKKFVAYKRLRRAA